MQRTDSELLLGYLNKVIDYIELRLSENKKK